MPWPTTRRLSICISTGCENYVGVAQAASRSGQFDIVQKAIDSSQGKKCSERDRFELRETLSFSLCLPGTCMMTLIG